MEIAQFNVKKILIAALLALSVPAFAQKSARALSGLIVDKKTNLVHVVDVAKFPFEFVKSYNATLGLVPGDKEKEGDKKTPEGIYFFEEFKRQPNINKKFGRLAITLNYPNAWDKYVRHTGSAIWLHSTDEPERLSRKFDSLGCVVVNNEEIEEIASEINYRSSPILIYEDFNASTAALAPARVEALRSFVTDWARNWSSKDLDGYIAHYHPNFVSAGKNVAAWKDYKGQLNKRYATIKVELSKLTILPHPKYDVAIFNQVYESKSSSGSVAKRSSSVKILYIDKVGEDPKILSEDVRNTAL